MRSVHQAVVLCAKEGCSCSTEPEPLVVQGVFEKAEVTPPHVQND